MDATALRQIEPSGSRSSASPLMVPTLSALIALQRLDSAADLARRRVAELPAARQVFEARVLAATALVDSAKARQQANQQKRRQLEKDVAVVDTRLARFEDHKAAVKTNHEYTALLHEITTAKTEKEGIEEQILVLMEEGDVLAAEVKAEETTLAATRREGEVERRALDAEQASLDTNIATLVAERTHAAKDVDKPLLAKYDQLLKQRRGIAVAAMHGEICMACHVRLRPHVVQQIRRNDQIIQCDSCQRVLYHEVKVEA